MKRFILLAIMFLGRFEAGLAQELPSFLPLNQETTARQASIPVYSEKQCRELLGPVVEPAAVIGQGLKALRNVIEGSDTLGCVSELVTGWERIAPELRAAPGLSQRESYLQDPAYLLAREKAAKLSDELRCTPPPPGGLVTEAKFKALYREACHDKFFDPASREEKRNSRIQAETEYFDIELSSRIRQNFPSRFGQMAAGFGAKPSPPEAELAQMTQRQKALEQYASLRDSSDLRFDWNKLEEITTRAACVEGKMDPAYGSLCEKRGFSRTADLAAIRQELRAAIANVDAVADELIGQRSEIEKRLATKTRESFRDYEQKYGLRRLLAHYHAYAKRAGGKGSLNKFCAENEAEYRRDAQFADRIKSLLPIESDIQWHWAKESGTTEAELAAIQLYSQVYYHEINPALYAATPAAPIPPEQKVFQETLDSALAKAEPYRGGPVLRYSKLPEAVLAQHRPGVIVTYAGFVSTSKNKDWTWNDEYNEPPHRFVIYGGARGVDVQELSASSNEGEVLFRSGTRFKVLSRKPRTKGQAGAFEFVLAEVDDQGRVIAKGVK